jgi:hypothetical protein
MGLRGELFSTRVILQNRTYFFNVKENRMGDLYLNIVESKNRETGGFDRQSIILFADDLQEFLKGFDESLRILEKETRERRRSSKSETPGEKFDKPDRGPRDDKPVRDVKLARDDRKTGPKGALPKGAYQKGNRPERPRKDRPPRNGKKIVVRKR